MREYEYLSHLYQIASLLNKEFTLSAALRRALETTVDLLGLETGWIWLVEKDLRSVFLAASYNLPPALKDRPERLSGWCYCIDHYLTGRIEEAVNISEITCTRLKDLKTGTNDLRFHATIPIITNDQKVGLINLVSREKQQLDEQQLSTLNTISELIGIAIQRTRLQEYHQPSQSRSTLPMREIIERVIQSRLDELHEILTGLAASKELGYTFERVGQALDKTEELRQQIWLLLEQTIEEYDSPDRKDAFRFPSSPLTARELEVLVLVKKGMTNKQIAEQLYISERTVKFHITSIHSKLHASTRTQAVDIALRRGLLS